MQILQNCNISKKILKYQATQLIKIMLIVYLINYHIKFIYFKNIENLMFKCKYYKIVIFYEIALLSSNEFLKFIVIVFFYYHVTKK